MKKQIVILTTLALFFAPMLSKAQGTNEYLLYINNGLTLQSANVHAFDNSNTIAKAENTLSQGIGIKYSRIFTSQFLVSAGVEANYQKYSTKILFPFYEFGFIPSGEHEEKYEINAFIPAVQVDLNIGYRYTKLRKIKPEFRIGHILRLPLSSKQFRYDSFEPAVTGFTDINFSMYGYYGKAFANSVSVDMINYASLGVYLPSNTKGIERYYIGALYRTQLIFRNTPFDYFYATYNDVIRLKTYREEFKGIHNQIMLTIGIIF